MTREEWQNLFSAFPRPWRLAEEEIGVVLDAAGADVLVINRDGTGDDDDVMNLVELIVELINEAKV